MSGCHRLKLPLQRFGAQNVIASDVGPCKWYLPMFISWKNKTISFLKMNSAIRIQSIIPHLIVIHSFARWPIEFTFIFRLIVIVHFQDVIFDALFTYFIDNFIEYFASHVVSAQRWKWSNSICTKSKGQPLLSLTCFRNRITAIVFGKLFTLVHASLFKGDDWLLECSLHTGNFFESKTNEMIVSIK